MRPALPAVLGVVVLGCSLPEALKISAGTSSTGSGGSGLGGAGASATSTTSAGGAGGTGGGTGGFAGSGGGGALEVAWALGYGTMGNDRAQAVALDGAGRALVAGRYDGESGTFDLGTGPLDAHQNVFVTARDAAGQAVWAKDSGAVAGGSEEAGGIAVDASDDVFLTGSFNGYVRFRPPGMGSDGVGDVWIARFDAAGDHVWTSVLASSGADRPWALAHDGQDLFVTGVAGGDIQFRGMGIMSEDKEGFLGKLTPDGTFTWVEPLGSIGTPTGLGHRGTGVVGAPGGRGRVVGTYDGTLDLLGGSCTSKTSDGPDVFVAEIDAVGCKWLKTFGGAGPDESGGVAQIGADIVVAGTYATAFQLGSVELPSPGSPGTFVTRLNASGDPIWSRGIVASNGGIAATAVAFAAGRALVAGRFDGSLTFAGRTVTSLGGEDALILVFDGDTGDDADVVALPGEGDEGITAMAGRGNDVLVGGYFTGSVDAGGSDLSSTGNEDVLMALLKMP